MVNQQTREGKSKLLSPNGHRQGRAAGDALPEATQGFEEGCGQIDEPVDH